MANGLHAAALKELWRITGELQVARDDLDNIRSSPDATSREGRHLSIAITAVEDALLRIEETIRATMP